MLLSYGIPIFYVVLLWYLACLIAWEYCVSSKQLSDFILAVPKKYLTDIVVRTFVLFNRNKKCYSCE